MTELRNLLESRGLEDVIAERIAHIDKHGHSFADDIAQPVERLMFVAREFAQIAGERAIPGERQDLEKARKKAVQAAAALLAGIDVLDHHIARIPPKDGPDLLQEEDEKIL